MSEQSSEVTERGQASVLMIVAVMILGGLTLITLILFGVL